MIGKSSNQNQRDLFNPLLSDFINMSHELVLLGDNIDWKFFDREFEKFYSNTGQPAMPVRLMVGCLMLKRLYNLGDETLAQEWIMNPYMQYFCGEARFRHKFPFDPSDFVHFRKRIGDEGIEKIFQYSVSVHGDQRGGKMELSDTTVQENNISFPTDAKLAKRVIDKCNHIADDCGIVQRQTYSRKSKQHLRDTYNSHHPRRRKKAKRAAQKLRTIAGRQVRELERELAPGDLELHQNKLALFRQVLAQDRFTKNKIYSLHKPFTACIAKGKAHKQYEFGNKIGLVMNPKTKVITAIDAFSGNPHDSNTIEPLLNQMERLLGYLPSEIVYDRGGRGKNEIKGVKISTPAKPLKTDNEYQRRKKRKKFRMRAAIEPVIGHLKSDFRMQKNYLHGEKSPKINAMMAAAGWNLKKFMKHLVKNIFWPFYQMRIIRLFLLSRQRNFG